MWSLPFHLIKKFACLIMTREQKEDFIKLTENLLSSEEENWLTTAADIATIVAMFCAIITLLLQVFA